MPKRTLLAFLLALGTAAAGAAPQPLSFDGESFRRANGESNDAAVRDIYLREGDTPERFSRMLRVGRFKGEENALTLATGAASLARIRAPRMGADTFSPEGKEQSDITVAWLQVSDTADAIEYHVVRYVDAKRGVREYAFVLRRYLNGRPLAAVLEEFGPYCVANQALWITELSALDRAPEGK